MRGGLDQNPRKETNKDGNKNQQPMGTCSEAYHNGPERRNLRQSNHRFSQKKLPHVYEEKKLLCPSYQNLENSNKKQLYWAIGDDSPLQRVLYGGFPIQSFFNFCLCFLVRTCVNDISKVSLSYSQIRRHNSMSKCMFGLLYVASLSSCTTMHQIPWDHPPPKILDATVP